MSIQRENHWQAVYRTKNATEVSWYAPHLDRSIELIREVAAPGAEIIDVGGGASTLVDDLLAGGFSAITVLDISQAALDIAQHRLGVHGRSVRWIQADITTADLPAARYDVWHDRAVFHFLTETLDRRAYVETLKRSVKDGGHVVIATFALDGPPRCSGLDVVRYDGAALQRQLGSPFELTRSFEESHATPAGKEQRFNFCRFRKTPAAG